MWSKFKNEASFSLIHDLGGYDTIDLSGSSANNDIENRQIDLGGGAFYQAGNKTIIWEDDYQTGAVYTTSFDTEIEKFIGSNGIDNVTLGPTSDTVFTNGGDDQIWNIGTYKLLSSTKVNAGSGDDSVFVTVYDNSELNRIPDLLNRIFAERKKFNSLSKKCRKVVIENYSKNIILNKYKDLLI